MSNGTTDTTLSNPTAIETAARAATTATIAGRHLARAAVGPLRRQAGRRRPEWRTGAAREARRAFGELGPTYVKLAQLIASSPGLFPEVLSDELRSLLDRVPPAPPGDIDHVIHRELGASPGDVFAEFSPEPLASASIAQVHTAVLRDGTEVVVKVQRRGIRARLATDLRILAAAADLLERASATGRMANPAAVVEDFENTLAHELTDHSAPVSVAMTRQLLWRMAGAEHPMMAHRLDSRSIQSRGQARDVGEGVGAFLEKRAPVWPDKVSEDLPGFFDWRSEPPFV